MSAKISDAEALLSLEKDSTAHRSKIGRLRSVFREIEELQVKGFSNQAIVDKLNEVGYGLTLKTFETMLYRIRKEAGTTKRASMAAVVSSGPMVPALAAGENLDCAIQSEPVQRATPETKITVEPGKTLTEQVLSSETKHFSLKQLKKGKENK
ncbi:hypothetical protein ACFFKC_22350 [Pseudoduganella danionis]|uniref:hypothetical protein n=1 Tax=Pseudoduganella danionis TaxID=1890295 RepID=UPI0018B07E6B|nr:hypothetical protein [Pseudoduganella danionis]